MLEKLGKVGEISSLVADLMSSLAAPEVRLPMAERLGTRVTNRRYLQVANPQESRRDVESSSSCVGKGKTLTRLGEVRLTRGATGRVVTIPEGLEPVEMSDLDQAEKTVMNIVFEDNQGLDSDIEILEPKPMLAVKQEEMEMEVDELLAVNPDDVVGPEPILDQVTITGSRGRQRQVDSTSSMQVQGAVSGHQEAKEPARNQDLLDVVGAGMCTGRPAGMSDSDPGDSDYGQYSDGFVSNAVNAYDGVAQDMHPEGLAS
jgi:hypothetical protein